MGNPDAKRQKMSQLDRLKTMTSVVADTGDFTAIKKYKPEDCTTNPSLLLQASKMDEFKPLLEAAAKESMAKGHSKDALVDDICDRLAVKVGLKLLEMLPSNGRVSTEVDADLSFDTEKSIEKAKKIIRLYQEAGVGTERILVKLGSTWESIQACKVLEQHGIHCNMTLLFSFCQAVACAEVGATLISPFVGRILDWHKKAHGKESYESLEDPGVISVSNIYKYYKAHGYKTIVMGASFRNTGEITALGGCDKLTIAPKLLEELQNNMENFDRQLDPGCDCNIEKTSFMDERKFRWAFNEDAMATEKLAEGIRNFAKDGKKLKNHVKEYLKTHFPE